MAKVKIILKRLILSSLCLLLTPAWSAERTTYYHLDLLGSPVAATDSNGQVVWREEYQPYGERTLGQDPNTRAPGYTGKVHEEALGLSYYGARWYDPELGRFTGIDPVDVDENNPHSFNRYAYANNNPYKYVDPDGRVVETAIDIISLGLSIGLFNQDPSIANGLGVAFDGFATVVPFLPGGFGIIKSAGNISDGVGDVTKGAGKSLKDQAADLIPKNANKNRVTLRSPSQKMEVDLAGRTHGGVPTPHTKVSPRNLKAPNQPAFNTKNSPVRPATQQDIRTSRRFLERQGRQ